MTPKFKKANEDGQSAFFKCSELNKLYIEGIKFINFTKLKNISLSLGTCNGIY